MDIKKEIGVLNKQLSESSSKLNRITRGMRPQNGLKQELSDIETNINKVIFELREIEDSLE